MREALKAKTITFENTVLTRKNLDKLVELLYKNIDLMASSLSQ